MATTAASVEPHSEEGEEVVVEEEEEYESEYEEIEVEEEVLEEVEEEIEDGDDDVGEALTPINEENDRNEIEVVEEVEEAIGDEDDDMTGEALTPINQESDRHEIEVVEEVEEEIEDEDDDVTVEALTPINEENNRNDNSPLMDPKQPEEHIKSDSTTPREFIANAPDDPVLEGGQGNPCRTNKQDESSGSRTPIKEYYDKASVGDNEVKSAENTEIIGGEMVAAVGSCCFGGTANGVQCFEEEMDRAAALEAVDIRQRSDATKLGQRSRSPEFNDGNKRPAIICDFYSKGWCIKGKSCRFLHVREKVYDSSQHKGDVSDAAKQKIEHLIGEDPSAGQDSALYNGENPKRKSEDRGLLAQKVNPGSVGSPRNFGRESLGRPSYRDGDRLCASLLVKDSSQACIDGSSHRVFSCSPLVSSDTNRNTEISYIAASMGEETKKTQLIHGDESFAVSSRGQKISSFSNRDPSPTRMCLSSNPDYQGSVSSLFQRHASSYPGSESGNLSRINTSEDTWRYAELKSNTSFGNWEPSVPFRPSYLITQRLLSTEKLYDPIRDSLPQTNSTDELSQFSRSDQFAYREGTKLQVKANAKSAETLCPEYSCSKDFDSGLNFCNHDMRKNVHEKDLCNLSANGFQIEGTSTTKQQNRSSLLKREKSLNSVYVGGIKEADKTGVDECGLHTDKQKQVTESEVESSRNENDADLHPKSDGYMHKESMELKNFHTALVERMKELIRQPWHEGLLSKDAYKLIVKKSVDKVLSTFQPHQIPSTSESVNQYLTYFHSKLEKLAEAYVDKYGKSLHG